MFWQPPNKQLQTSDKSGSVQNFSHDRRYDITFCSVHMLWETRGQNSSFVTKCGDISKKIKLCPKFKTQNVRNKMSGEVRGSHQAVADDSAIQRS